MSVSSDYLKSEKNWMANIFPIFKQFKDKQKYGYTQYNGPDKRAWVSVSKKMSVPIYEITKRDFMTEFGIEIEHAKDFKVVIKNTIHIDE